MIHISNDIERVYVWDDNNLLYRTSKLFASSVIGFQYEDSLRLLDKYGPDVVYNLGKYLLNEPLQIPGIELDKIYNIISNWEKHLRLVPVFRHNMGVLAFEYDMYGWTELIRLAHIKCKIVNCAYKVSFIWDIHSAMYYYIADQKPTLFTTDMAKVVNSIHNYSKRICRKCSRDKTKLPRRYGCVLCS
jgi:hypothetical protein